MAGILNKKTRFIDLVVTQEGKRQIASGLLRAEFASANDSQADYQVSDKYEDAVKKIYFEVMERPENSITLEVDDSGKLLQFDMSPTGSIVGNKIFQQGTFGETQEDVKLIKLATGSQFASLFNGLSKNVINNFSKNYFVGSKDSINFNNTFEISRENAIFTIVDTVPFRNGPRSKTINVNDADPFFLDKKLTHLPNFSFLPPVNEDGSPYGVYEDFRSTKNLNWEDIQEELGKKPFKDQSLDLARFAAAHFESRGIGGATLSENTEGDENIIASEEPIKKPFQVINFTKTSQSNNLLIQIFENFNDNIKKLDIIDGGVFSVLDDANGNFEKQIFYVGKVYFDDFNTPTFINLFTLVFE
tara:strand:+ start:2958 stop:4034 length:1077 start_codon:yes stop_codon:yes gene_type:complete